MANEPAHLAWFDGLPEHTKKLIELWGEADGPTHPGQLHYSADDAAKALGLHPITMRQYLREKRVPGRKVGGQWRVPYDAIIREIYNKQHVRPAHPDIPIGIVVAWTPKPVWQAVSNWELEGLKSEQDVRKLLGRHVPEGVRVELWPAVSWFEELQTLGLVREQDSKPWAARETPAGQFYALSRNQRILFDLLAAQAWFNTGIHEFMEQCSEVVERDIEDDIPVLRLIRHALELQTRQSGNEQLIREMDQALHPQE